MVNARVNGGAAGTLRLFLFLALAAGTVNAQTGHRDDSPRSSFRFLLGNWTSVSKPGEGTGYSVFSSEVQGLVILRKNHAEYPASPGRPAGVHDDLMMIFRGGSPDTLRATYVDNEGHLIEYVVGSPGTDEMVLTSETRRGSPRYRLWYGMVSSDTVAGRFDIAPPGKPHAFSRYLEWRMVRSVTPR